jgi:exodeoxyribonuclease V alpha subunit
MAAAVSTFEAKRRAADASAAEVVALVKRIRHAKAESGWTSATVQIVTAAESIPLAAGESVAAIGTALSGIKPGETLRLRARYQDDPRWGKQLQVLAAVVEEPQDVAGLRSWLETLAGVGPVRARAIIARFGDHALEVVYRDPSRLIEVEGITPALAADIIASIKGRREEAEASVLLRSWGVPDWLCTRLLRDHRDQAAAIVQHDPYSLTHYKGVGFLTADEIAQRMGTPLDFKPRINAGILYALEEASGEGHVFLPRKKLLSASARLLKLTKEKIAPCIGELADCEGVIVDGPAVYHPRFYGAECSVASRLLEIMAASCESVMAEPIWGELEPSDSQRAAVDAVAGNAKVLVITGGPGMGKTTLLKVILDMAARGGMRIAACAPTGRAAKRMREATGFHASTIHRLLKYNGNSWGYHSNDRLFIDLLVIDETSMVDIELMSKLLEATPDGARVVIVGDPDQLASVGPGRVLRDLIDSGPVMVAHLDHVFRQAAESAIVMAAHRINAGLPPKFNDRGNPGDFYFVEADEADEAVDLIVKLASQSAPNRLKLTPRDVQVLSPMKKYVGGVDDLNLRLQAALNPNGEPIPWREQLRIGDRVMQKRNNYGLSLGVFNGDQGYITAMSAERSVVEVEIDGEKVEYARNDLRDLDLAYCCTVHKAQGGEAPIVIMFVHTRHAIMLKRQLLYTGITRGRRLVVLVGQKEAVTRAAEDARETARHSALIYRLRQASYADNCAEEIEEEVTEESPASRLKRSMAELMEG